MDRIEGTIVIDHLTCEPVTSRRIEIDLPNVLLTIDVRERVRIEVDLVEENFRVW